MMAVCCDAMNTMLLQKCKQHPDPFECPDQLIAVLKSSGEYGIIIHDGGGSVMVINYCPWCGVKLPDGLKH